VHLHLPSTTTGTFHFAWVIPYGIATIAMALSAWPVLRRIGARNGILFTLAAGTFLSGALGFEMIGGRYLEVMNLRAAQGGPGYAMLTTIEETLEMLGLAVLSYALLTLIQDRYGGCTFRLRARDSS